MTLQFSFYYERFANNGKYVGRGLYDVYTFICCASQIFCDQDEFPFTMINLINNAFLLKIIYLKYVILFNFHCGRMLGLEDKSNTSFMSCLNNLISIVYHIYEISSLKINSNIKLVCDSDQTNMIKLEYIHVIF